MQILEAGAKAMLVGESLVRADDIGARIQDLRGTAGQEKL